MSQSIGILNRIRSLPPFPAWMRRPVIILRVVLGTVFIISGMMKVLDARSFVETLPLYNLPSWFTPLGVLAPPVEVAIGAALIAGTALKATALATLGLLAGFSVLLIVGIAGGQLSECGCFGPALEQSPQSALLRNVLLMLIAGVIWYYYRGSRAIWRSWHVGLGTALLLVLGIITGYTIHTPTLDPSSARVGELFPDEGFGKLAPELTGRQLVYVFVVDCPHCWNAVANVKALAADSTYGVFGLTESDPHEIGWYANEFDINFKVYSYNPELFNTAFRSWPSLYYLEDGIVIGKVEGEVPAPRTLEEEHMAQWR
ncbi:MAG: DoxX family membrane protein [Fidelibacterota bacterium]|nr:MAG: DoxX family membrane protein [Candidatus Neomarinimicrobiota bacterium]